MIAVGRNGIGVATDNQNNTGVLVPGRTDPVTIGVYEVDGGFQDAMGLNLIAGRWFDEARQWTTCPCPIRPMNRPVALTNAAARLSSTSLRPSGSVQRPRQAVGKTFGAAWLIMTGPGPVTIIGVVKDSRFRSIKEPLDPIMFLKSVRASTAT